MKLNMPMRSAILIGLLAFVMAPLAHAANVKMAKKLEVIRFAMPTKAIAPLATNYLIPQRLGYYRKEGLTAEFTPVGSVAAAMAAVVDNHAEFAAMPASNVIELAARGSAPDIKAFYEMTYPFKYGIAVNPDSPLKSISQLRGKTVGIANFGTSEYIMGQALLRAAGLNPKTDVHWLAVGVGATAGLALQQKRIAAYIYWDTGFGQIEAAGIKLRFLPIPNPPDVGGIFIFTRASFMKTHRQTVIGVGRAIAKTSLFIQTNPRAAAYAYIQQFPSATPKVASVKKQVDALAVPIKWRMPLYRSKDPALKSEWGKMSLKEWKATAEFLHVKNPGNLGRLFTNDLISQINKFDEAKVVETAKHAPQQ